MTRKTPRRSAVVHLTLISQGEVPPQDAEHVLKAAFAAEDYSDCIKALKEHEIDPQAYIDNLDLMINTLSPRLKSYHSGILALQEVCVVYGLLPSSYIKLEPFTPVSSGSQLEVGGLANVRKVRDSDGCLFAIKEPHWSYSKSHRPELVKKRLCKMVITCRRIRHENVLVIEGVTPGLFEFCTVTKWMDNGTILHYVRGNPEVDRMRLLTGITRGLRHLHSNKLIHGNLNGFNILIDRGGNPLLSGFSGLSFTKESIPVATLERPGILIRWSAPELVNDEIGIPTTKSDVYSLSMVIVGLYSGDVPFSGLLSPAIKGMLLKGTRPPKPESAEVLGLTPALWALTKKCWARNPAKRPDTSAILAHLEARIVSDPPSSPKLLEGSGKSRPTERRTIKDQNLQRPTAEAWVSVEVDRRDPDEEFSLQTEGSATVTSIGTQQQKHEAISPQTPSFSVLQNSGFGIQGYIERMDNRLGNHIIPDRERQKLLNKLCKTCSRYRAIPASMHIPDCSQGSVEVAEGNSAIVWKSMHKGVCVAVKVFRVFLTSDLGNLLSGFCREGVAWKHLRHPNILPLLGVTISEQRLAMVSEWMDNGNINQFIEKDQHANRPMLVVDVAYGLKYLHDLRIVHADLKGANILINKHKRACIADFGLATINGVAARAAARSSQLSLSTIDSLMSFTPGGTFRWMSPELLDPERFLIPQSDESDRPTTQSDCYAFGMVIYEVLCGHHPYLEIVSDILLRHAITSGVRPKKPEEAARLGFTEDLWKTVEQCWLEDRGGQPSVEDILPYLNDATLHWDTRQLY
ncbi:kinase-like domain-containing protein [Thelephora terrestris]|uniref:Kinase-like domain-containing protein n=1 Tax=Thelephora terrestris TaxID=56493 RepID=A0A9P6HNQ4_9AGAM|nr:kinase-like domain-containing protein [Thelephora terrestris]